MSAGRSESASKECIGDCYRIEDELGHGGTARVYRVLDERSGRRLALKRLAVGKRQATLHAMFEREYRALAQLVHPRIVRVFDYGIDGEQPYYTMELLEGTDLRRALKTQTFSIREICIVLRDVASALALIHSRRLVHRDVGPRNVWLTPEYRAKLIDFGTLVAIGPQSRAAGTPPYVPPEAVSMQPLDGRCDLYALGALAYQLLTRHNAYPARDIEDLRHLWLRRPQRPDAVRSDVPASLSELVMALLSLDARGRPASAAEVVERLTAIAELPHDDERHLAQSFLISPTLVGRADGLAQLRTRLQRARTGRCNMLAIVAGAGLGRSRMLESCALEAKLMGATTIVADAGAAGQMQFALAGVIAERLLELSPRAALEAHAAAAVLANVSPGLRAALGGPVPAPLTPLESASKLSAGFVALFAAAGRDQPVVIAVDDVNCGDEASLSVLARLAQLSDARLLLVVACDRAVLDHASPLIERLTRAPDRIELAPLAHEDTRALLGSMFGDAPGLDAAAAWLHELSQGSPQTCMQYAQYLVDHGLARYEGGRWRLPERIREQSLPATLEAVLEARMQSLSADARALALGLALARDESRAAWQPEKHIAVKDLPVLLDDAPASRHGRAASRAARAFDALDELLHAGILQQRDDRYVLAQRSVGDALLRSSDAEQQRAMHRRLATTLEREGAVDMAMVRHLQRAGDHARARELLLRSAERLAEGGALDWGEQRVSVTAECARVAHAHWQEHGGSPREGVLLRRMLLLTCSVYDWNNARVGGAQFDQLRADSGLVYWDATDASRPRLERVRACLARAQREHDRTPEQARGVSPSEAVRELAACGLMMYGALATSFDVAQGRRLVELLEPLRELSPAMALIADQVVLGLDRATGRELGDRMLECAERARRMHRLPKRLRDSTMMYASYGQAIADLRQGRARALELADRMAAGTSDEFFLVAHLRWLGHAFRGRADERHRRPIETACEDDVWRRKACLFIELELFALTGDLPNLERTREAIAALAEQFPGWLSWLACARAAIHRWRGELPAAQAELEAALALALPGEHRAWVAIAPALAEVLLLRGDAERALQLAASIVAEVEARSLNRNAAIAAERVRALAASSRADHVAALAAIDRAFALAAELGFDGLPLAQLHETHARVLLAAGDARACAAALAALRGLIDGADAPALIQAYEALVTQSPPVALSERAAVPEAQQPAESSQLLTEVSSRIGAHVRRSDRAEQALGLLIENSGASAGHLFLFDDDRLLLAASSDPSTAHDELSHIAQRHFDELSKTGSDVTTTARVGRSTRPFSAAEPFAPVLLRVDLLGEGGHETLAVGITLLTAPQRMPRPALVRVISRCLKPARDDTPL